MTRIGDKYKLEVGPDGKTRVIEDTKAIQAKKPVSARYAKDKERYRKAQESATEKGG
jgi:hypothetical protein